MIDVNHMTAQLSWGERSQVREGRRCVGEVARLRGVGGLEEVAGW